MLVTRWIWEEEHYLHAIAYLKVRSVEEYIKGIATFASFKGFRIVLETAGDLERAGYSPPLLTGNGGAGESSADDAADGEGFGARGLFSVPLGGQRWRGESPADNTADGGGFGARGLFSVRLGG
jgi:hypothetical protein